MRVVLLPCDTRPPTLELPQQLARMAGIELVVPAPGLLNYLNQPAPLSLLAQWLRQEAQQAEALVVSLEMLTLGGMIPARRVDDPLEGVLTRLELLRQLKNERPNLRILAHGVILRVAHDNDPLEEKPYYGQWGDQLRQYSELTDRAERSGDTSWREQQVNLQAQLPTEILANWLATRQRSRQLHQAAVDLLEQGVIHYLALTLDDTTPYGLAARDRRSLETLLDQKNLWSRANIYPGADEVSATLLARLVSEERGRPPLVYVQYPSPLSPQATTLYEDRPLGELVQVHLRAVGARLALYPEQADLVLAVNAPAVAQASTQPDWVSVDTPARSLPWFVDQIAHHLDEGRLLALADLAYPNGAELRLMGLLGGMGLHRLQSFAAWNTAGNSLGSALAGGLAALGSADLPRLEALFSRLTDDWLYQSVVRPQLVRALSNPDPYHLGEQLGQATQRLQTLMPPMVQELWQAQFAPFYPGIALEMGQPSLAWPRLFTGVFPLKLVKSAQIPEA
jgi:hypothetical protein